MASSHVCSTSLPISGLYFILPRCRFMSHDKIWGQRGTDAQNHFSWFEVSAGMLQTALVRVEENRQAALGGDGSSAPALTPLCTQRFHCVMLRRTNIRYVQAWLLKLQNST